MNRGGKQPRGQALVLIVFAIVGMVGLTALAIDGGNVYSDRRHAQNAADTAALAAGLRKIRCSTCTDWDVPGYNIAASNGYQTGVSIYPCDQVPSGMPACVLAPGEAHPEYYIQVVITSVVHTYFAPVVGIRTVTNTVQAIARAVPGSTVPWAMGNALVSLMKGCQENNVYPFSIGGGQLSLVNGSGVFVNSACADGAFKQSQNSTINAPDGVCIIGGIDPSSNTSGDPTPPTENCTTPQIDLATYKLPPLSDASCTSNGQIVDEGGGVKHATPGRYSGTFPPGSFTTLKLYQGIYCLQGDFTMTGNGTLTTDLNGNGSPDSGEGALFYVKSGSVSISGGTNTHVFLAAIPPSSGISADLANYLFYLPPTNTSTFKLTGGSSNVYIGTILAPGALVTLDGGSTSDSLDLQAQIIGYSVNLTGGGTLDITYNQSQNAFTTTNPELTEYK